MKTLVLLILALFLFRFNYTSSGCSIFTSSSKNAVLAGNNEDMCTTNTIIHVMPPSDGSFGRIFWGFKGDGNYQGGMNGYGLFFDGAGTPPVEMSGWDLPEFDGRYIMETVLEKCKTVEEAINFVKDYAQPYLKFSHILVADSTGDAAILEWGNNQMNFIRKGNNNFLIATNFNLTESGDPEKQCNRYATAKKMLANEEPTVSLFEKILSLTHAEGKFPTVYSNVCDLRNKKIYLYNFHNYLFRKEFDLKTVFKGGEKKYMIRSFFPENNSELLFRLMNDCIEEFEDLPQHTITFKINVQQPLNDTGLFIQGSAKELGDWDKPGIEMEKINEKSYEKTISFKEGLLFDFAVTDEKGKFIPLNTELKQIGEQVVDVKKDTTIVIDVFKWKEKQ